MKFLFILAGLAGLGQLVDNDITSTPAVQPDPPQTFAKASLFPIGFAVNPAKILSSEPYWQTVSQEASMVR